MIAFIVDENLRFVFQSPKSRGVKNTVTVALKPVRLFGFILRVQPSAAVFTVNAVGSQRTRFNLLQHLSGKHGLLLKD
jgi:hypothetical protein